VTKELLDLSTVVARDTIRITSKLHKDGKSYEVAHPDDFSIYQLEKIGQLQVVSQTLQTAASKRKLKPAEERQMAKALHDTVALIVPAMEPTVLKALTDTMCLRIIGVWQSNAPELKETDQGNAGRRRSGRG
jgi:predicted GTPase